MNIELIMDNNFISNDSDIYVVNGSRTLPDIKIHNNEHCFFKRKNVTEFGIGFSGNNVDGNTGIDIENGASKFEFDSQLTKFSDEIYHQFLLEKIELGCESKTALLINDSITKNGYKFVDTALSQLMGRHIINSGKPIIMCKFLTLLTELDVKLIPLTSSYAVTSFSHKKYDSVKEMILMAIELWKHKDALVLLEDMEPYSRRHLEQYRLKIINMLKRI
ncbi:hypothetical protein [Klebsiella pneumoniae]|uniref:hypothetical protein n=1 Tax=Klebsiella pneumoniae TaxID=573 RepID=UPI0007CBBF73|nr:hypothetical protein [Klebsiella pneumoniae]HCB0506776.1 hypothetical protein [Klebsiella variicola subsp. variicola]MBZ7319225.1 hypothetical protein [Klebsiella pneumoniae]MCF0405411.1 hypothetical protein [Klebsiella pneumoniae]MCP6557996.1 hypothetical protein [Klebsiella pneumoniae]OUH23964.1 hypothetical protein AZ017_001217 [Klebsiella pneumoniae]